MSRDAIGIDGDGDMIHNRRCCGAHMCHEIVSREAGPRRIRRGDFGVLRVSHRDFGVLQCVSPVEAPL